MPPRRKLSGSGHYLQSHDSSSSDKCGSKTNFGAKKIFGAKIFLFDFFTFYAISKRFFVKSDITKFAPKFFYLIFSRFTRFLSDREPLFVISEFFVKSDITKFELTREKQQTMLMTLQKGRSKSVDKQGSYGTLRVLPSIWSLRISRLFLHRFRRPFAES